jgi:methyltransferase (TIGR00027 family)
MREGRPSFTAAAVAAARGIAGVDPVAIALVDGALAALVRAGRGRTRAAAVNVATLGLVDHVEMRTLAIDAALRDAVAAGVRQLVVLGAGLDARAWRLPELAEVDVFEVDHPATQSFKRARVGGRPPLARRVRFVPVDFQRDALGEALAGAGHDAGAPTAWLWEGVVPYLPRPAVRATLADIGERSASRSRLMATYATPQATSLGPTFVRAARASFRVMGEPLVGLIATEALHAELGRVSFRVLDDASARDWAERHGGGRRRLMLLDERLVVAVR